VTAYAEVTDVLARAGVLAEAFEDERQPVGKAEIATFLAQTAGELNAAIGAVGYAVPVVDTIAAAALTSVNADMASTAPTSSAGSRARRRNSSTATSRAAISPSAPTSTTSSGF
jgi:hypothetical protein